MEVSAAEAGVTHEASPDDPSVRHTIRSLPPLTLRMPLALRQALEAQAAQAGLSLNAYLTQVLTAAVEGIPGPLDADLMAWLETWRHDGESLGVVMAALLTELRELLEDRSSNLVLLSIPPELQPWLTTQASRYRTCGREQAILGVLRRAAQAPVRPARPPHAWR
jgi:HicB family